MKEQSAADALIEEVLRKISHECACPRPPDKYGELYVECRTCGPALLRSLCERYAADAVRKEREACIAAVCFRCASGSVPIERGQYGRPLHRGRRNQLAQCYAWAIRARAAREERK